MRSKSQRSCGGASSCHVVRGGSEQQHSAGGSSNLGLQPPVCCATPSLSHTTQPLTTFCWLMLLRRSWPACGGTAAPPSWGPPASVGLAACCCGVAALAAPLAGPLPLSPLGLPKWGGGWIWAASWSTLAPPGTRCAGRLPRAVPASNVGASACTKQRSCQWSESTSQADLRVTVAQMAVSV